MERFVANFTLRLDSKGRVSIPGAFRAVLVRDGFEGLYCYPALDCPAIDAGGRALITEIEALIGGKVFLELFVRVEPGWSANPRRLAELGL